MRNALVVASVVLAFVSAALWFWSAWTKIDRGLYWETPEHVKRQIKKQNILSAAAAVATGLSAALQGTTLLL